MLFAVAGVVDLDHRGDKVVEVGFLAVEEIAVERDLEGVLLIALRRQNHRFLVRHAHDLGQEEPDGRLDLLWRRVGDDHVEEVGLLVVPVERAEDGIGPDGGILDTDDARVVGQRKRGVVRRRQHRVALVGVIEGGEAVFDPEAKGGAGGVGKGFGRVDFAANAGAQGQLAAQPVFGAQAKRGGDAEGHGQPLNGLVRQAEHIARVVELFGDAAVVREAGAADVLDRRAQSQAEGQWCQ